MFLGIVFLFFFGFKDLFCFSGWVAFGFLAFVAFAWVFVAFVAFHFASSASCILSIASSSLAPPLHPLAIKMHDHHATASF